MKKVYLAFLWHHHQPMYKNPSNGVYELPWVRLHATKDYYDTVAILDEFPKIKSNFNLVPSLLEQLNDYAKGIAKDKFLDLTIKNAEDLNDDDKIFILSNFFMANWETMIYPYPRYAQLLEKRGKKQLSHNDLKRVQANFKTSEIRDLQVWFNLSWMDPYWKTNDELVKYLFEKERNYTEEDKKALVNKQLEICGKIVTKYREVQDRGQIEVTITPFYHPILPLLYDTNNALNTLPPSSLPKKRFHHPEDAKAQIEKAVEYYESCFGKKPKGMWPSEGSVADDVIPLFAQAGIKWIATDEEILFRSKPEFHGARRKLYKPFKLNIHNTDLNIVFRDHGLSDAIGFVYSKWNPKDAVDDFLKKIYWIRDHMCESTHNCLVSVILDGENCWEYYPNDGWDFMRLLYKNLSADNTIETVTINDYLQKNHTEETLKTIWPGSWINGNYNIWIGHPEDNTAWSYLEETRKFLSDYIDANPDKKDSDIVKAAWEKIYIAEGSDWNWWYGSDHSSDNDAMFDFLFRQNLISVYEIIGEKVPDCLHKAIKGISNKQPIIEPIDFITPKIDGRISNYFEWQPAGCYKVGLSGGAMHQVDTVLKAFYYGFDLNNLYFRLDLNNALNDQSIQDVCLKIVFLQPLNAELILTLQSDGIIKEYLLKINNQIETLTSAAAKKIIELSIPIEKLQISDEQKNIEFVVVVQNNNLEVERWPYQGSVIFAKPSEEIKLQFWSV